MGCAVLLAALLSACATQPAPNFRGRWKPVNRLPDAPVAIPLQEAYVYSVGPMDKTLKQLLTRWAQGAKRTLSYLHPNDYTLYSPVQDIRTSDLGQAVSQLNAAYAAYDVNITVEAGQIAVRSAGPASADLPEQ